MVMKLFAARIFLWCFDRQVEWIGNPLINTVYSAVQNENSQPIVSRRLGLDRARFIYGFVGCHCRQERGG